MVSTPEALSSLLLTPTRSPLKSNQTQYLKIIRTPFIAAEFLEVFKAGPIGDACLKGGISTEFLFSTPFLSWFLSPLVFAEPFSVLLFDEAPPSDNGCCGLCLDCGFTVEGGGGLGRGGISENWAGFLSWTSQVGIVGIFLSWTSQVAFVGIFLSWTSQDGFDGICGFEGTGGGGKLGAGGIILVLLVVVDISIGIILLLVLVVDMSIGGILMLVDISFGRRGGIVEEAIIVLEGSWSHDDHDTEGKK